MQQGFQTWLKKLGTQTLRDFMKAVGVSQLTCLVTFKSPTRYLIYVFLQCFLEHVVINIERSVRVPVLFGQDWCVWRRHMHITEETWVLHWNAQLRLYWTLRGLRQMGTSRWRWKCSLRVIWFKYRHKSRIRTQIFQAELTDLTVYGVFLEYNSWHSMQSLL